MGTNIPNIGSSAIGDPIGKAVVEIIADDKAYQQGLKKSRKALADFDKETARITKTVSRNFAVAGAAIGAGLGVTIAKFAEFEKSMKNVQAVSGATSEEYIKLKNFALEMGSQTVFSAREAGDAMYFLASAGQSVEEQMQTTAAVLDLAAATQSGLAESSQIIVNSLSAFELQADQSRRVADLFAESISSSQANLEKLRISLPQTATVFNDLDQSIESNVAALSLLFDRGVRASTAARGLRNNLLTLLDVTPEAEQALSGLGLTVGDLNPQMNTLVDIVQKLETAGFDTADSVKIFGKESNALAVLVSTGADKLREFEESLLGAAGAAETMKDIQLDSLAGDLKLLSSAAEGAAIAFGEGLAPAVRTAAGALTALLSAFNALPGPVKAAFSILTASAAGLLGTLGLIGLAGPKIAAGLVIAEGAAVRLAFKLFTLGEKAVAVAGKLATLQAGAATAGSILLGIPAGIAVAAAGFKLGTNAIDDTREALTSFESVTKAQRQNMEKIQRGIDEWKEELTKLNTALDKGVTNTQRLNKATGEWIDTPLAAEISFAEGRIRNLNKELRIAGGDFSAATEKVVAMEMATSKLSTAVDIFLNPMDALGGFLLSLQEHTAGSATAMSDLAFAMKSLRGPLDFLTGDPGLPAFIRKVSVLESGIGRIKAALNEVIDIFDFSDAGGGERVAEIGTPRAETKESFRELQEDIAATEKANRELGESIKKSRGEISVEAFDLAIIARGAAAKAKASEDEMDNAANLQRELKRLADADLKRELEKTALINVAREKVHQEAIDAGIELSELELDEAARSAAGISDILTAEEAKRKKERKAAIKKLISEQEKAAADVLRAWQRTRNKIAGAFEGLFESLFREGKPAWERFWDDLKNIAIRKIAEIAVEETVGRVLDRLAGEGGQGGVRVGGGGDGGFGKAVTGAIVGAGANRALDKILKTDSAGGGEGRASLFDKLFGSRLGVAEGTPVPGGGTLGEKIFGFEPTVSTQGPGTTALVTAAKFAVPAVAVAGIVHGGIRTISAFLRHRELAEKVRTGELIPERRAIGRRGFTDTRRNIPGIEFDDRTFNQAAASRDSYIRIDRLELNMPSTIKDMSRAELDEATTQQIGSIARALNRNPRARRRMRR